MAVKTQQQILNDIKPKINGDVFTSNSHVTVSQNNQVVVKNAATVDVTADASILFLEAASKVNLKGSDAVFIQAKDAKGGVSLQAIGGVEEIAFNGSGHNDIIDLSGVSTGGAPLNEDLFRLYKSAFPRDASDPEYGKSGRDPDISGYNYWKAKMDGGISLEEVALNFVISDEAVGAGLKEPGALIDSLYNLVLGREADQDGKTYWMEKYEQISASQGHEKAMAAILTSFATSPELKGRADIKASANEFAQENGLGKSFDFSAFTGGGNDIVIGTANGEAYIDLGTGADKAVVFSGDTVDLGKDSASDFVLVNLSDTGKGTTHVNNFGAQDVAKIFGQGAAELTIYAHEGYSTLGVKLANGSEVQFHTDKNTINAIAGEFGLNANSYTRETKSVEEINQVLRTSADGQHHDTQIVGINGQVHEPGF